MHACVLPVCLRGTAGCHLKQRRIRSHVHPHTITSERRRRFFKKIIRSSNTPPSIDTLVDEHKANACAYLRQNLV